MFSKPEGEAPKFMKRVAILLSILMMLAPCMTQAQTLASSAEDAIEKSDAASEAHARNEQTTQVSIKLEEGDRVTLRNRFGPIVVTGGSGDTLEATATEIKKGTVDYKFQLVSSNTKSRVMLMTYVITGAQASIEKKDPYKDKDKDKASASSTTRKPAEAGAPQPRAQGIGGGAGSGRTPSPPRPATGAQTPSPQELESLRGVGEIKLEVKLPRNAHVDLIDSRRYALGTINGAPAYVTNTRNDVSVTNMDTPVAVISSGDVQAAKVAGLEARTRASNVYVTGITGPVSIATVTGAIVVKDARGDVRAVSITGSISIECARGRTEASNTNGIITLTGIGGDLEATTTGGTITFTGAIRDGGRYRMRSMTGVVRMFIQREPPGFYASLSSYRGQIQSDFELKQELSSNTATSDLPQTERQPVRRMIGRYGEGDARITLDSFSGTVQLGRAQNEVWKKCP